MEISQPGGYETILILQILQVTKGYGIPGLKQVMDWMGLYGGPTRSPLQSLSEQDAVKLHKIFVDAGYL